MKLAIIAVSVVAVAVAGMNNLILTDSLVQAQATLAEDAKTTRRKRKRNEEERTFQPLMKTILNNPAFHQAPLYPLERKEMIAQLLLDQNRNYSKTFTNLYSWELLELADLLKDKIEEPRNTIWRKKRKRNNYKDPERSKKRACNHDYIHRTFFCLEWLANGCEFKKTEFYSGWSKSSLNEDIPHVLRAIVDELDDEIKWPDADERAGLARESPGIFEKCVGICDIMEHPIVKSKDSEIEHRTFSGKEGSNTYMTFAVIDRHGYFRYVHTGIEGRRNDREAYVSLPLYMQRGEYFSGSQFLAADGGFDGDGPIQMSHRSIGGDADKALYNLAFKEVRMQVENAFGRVQEWFGILGNRCKKWHYDRDLLILAVHAAARLHNWMLTNRDLSYNIQSNPNYIYRGYH